MIKLLTSLLIITTNAFSLTPIVSLKKYDYKIQMSIPDYDPSLVINQLARSADKLDTCSNCSI